TRHYNPVLVGLSEAEGWLIVAEVVRRMARGDLPAGLCVRQVVALEWNALVRDLPAVGESESWAAPEHRWYPLAALAADAAQRGRFRSQRRHVPPDIPHGDRVERQRAAPINRPGDPLHQRLEAVLVEVRRSQGRVLLYVEQLQRLLGGEQESYPVD